MRADLNKQDVGDVASTHPHQHGPSTVATQEGGWWEVERAQFIRGRIVDLLDAHQSILDVGCGRGTLLGERSLVPGSMCVGVDSYIWPEWETHNTNALYVCALADQLPFRDGAFDVVGSFDVLEHLPDDERAIQEQARVVKPRGHVVASVPAHPKLWSAHDVDVGHRLRHTRQSLTVLARSAGLTMTRSTHFFSWLAPPAFLLRNKAKRGESPGNGRVVGQAVSKVAALLSACERAYLRRFDLPAGTSLWAEFQRDTN